MGEGGRHEVYDALAALQRQSQIDFPTERRCEMLELSISLVVVTLSIGELIHGRLLGWLSPVLLVFMRVVEDDLRFDQVDALEEPLILAKH